MSSNNNSTRERDKSKLVTVMAILAGVGGLWFNLAFKHSRYYLGEDLIEMPLQLETSPRHIKARSSDITGYYFKTVEYPCEFLLSKGAYTLVKDDEGVKKQIEEINPGDSVIIEIRANDKNLLEQSSDKIRVMGLRSSTARLVQPKMVEAEDKKWFIINISFALLALIGGLIVFFFREVSPDRMLKISQELRNRTGLV